ncbi:MAG TPA: hypothetical protein VI357_01380 [Mycobacteriales bacterium]
MSEADNTWRIAADGREHEIGIAHDPRTGRFVVTLDGIEIGDDRVAACRKKVDVPLGAHQAMVSVLPVMYANLGPGARSELHVDGRYVEPHRR